MVNDQFSIGKVASITRHLTIVSRPATDCIWEQDFLERKGRKGPRRSQSLVQVATWYISRPATDCIWAQDFLERKGRRGPRRSQSLVQVANWYISRPATDYILAQDFLERNGRRGPLRSRSLVQVTSTNTNVLIDEHFVYENPCLISLAGVPGR